MHGQPVHNTIHNCTPDCHPLFWAWMTSQLKEALNHKLRGSMMSLHVAYFLTCYPWVFVQPGTYRHPLDCCRNYCLQYLTLDKQYFQGNASIQ